MKTMVRGVTRKWNDIDLFQILHKDQKDNFFYIRVGQIYTSPISEVNYES